MNGWMLLGFVALLPCVYIGARLIYAAHFEALAQRREREREHEAAAAVMAATQSDRRREAMGTYDPILEKRRKLQEQNARAIASNELAQAIADYEAHELRHSVKH